MQQAHLFLQKKLSVDSLLHRYPDPTFLLPLPPASVPVNGSFRWGRETSILDQLFSNLFLCWTFYWEFILSTHSTCFVIQQWCIASRLTPPPLLALVPSA